MQYKKVFWCYTLVFLSWTQAIMANEEETAIMNACLGAISEEMTLQQLVTDAVMCADIAYAKIAVATDIATILEAAEVTVKVLDKITRAKNLANDLRVVDEARKKFRLTRPEVVKRLHQFLKPEHPKCKNVLDMLAQLELGVEKTTCDKKRGTADPGCHIGETCG